MGIDVANSICADIERKISGLLSLGWYKRADLEIIIGFQTERTIIEGADARWFTFEGSPLSAPTTLEGAIMGGALVHIDHDTPRLYAVRLRLDHRRP